MWLLSSVIFKSSNWKPPFVVNMDLPWNRSWCIVTTNNSTTSWHCVFQPFGNFRILLSSWKIKIWYDYLDISQMNSLLFLLFYFLQNSNKLWETLSFCFVFVTYVGLKFGDHDIYEIIEIEYKASKYRESPVNLLGTQKPQ